eukprot:EG_transcript_6855
MSTSSVKLPFNARRSRSVSATNRKPKLTVPIQDYDPETVSTLSDGSPPRRRSTSRGSISRSSSRGSLSGRGEYIGLAANLKAVVAAAKVSGAMQTKVELLAASTKLPAVKGQAAADSRKGEGAASGELQKKELARLRLREEQNSKAMMEQTILQSEADKRLKAEQVSFQKILKVKEDDLAHLRHVVETMQAREAKLLAQNRQLQLEVSRALTERDHHLIDVQAKDHQIQELRARIRDLNEQLKDRTEVTDHLTEMVNRHAGKSYTREQEHRAEVAAMLNKLQAQLNDLSEDLVSRLDKLMESTQSDSRPGSPSPLFSRLDPPPTAIPLNYMSAELLMEAENRYLGREKKLEQVVHLNERIEESTREFVRQLHQAKLAFSVLPDSLFLVQRGITMHSHLEVGLRAQLTRMSKEELLAVLDFVSKEDTVRDFLTCEFPLYTTMPVSPTRGDLRLEEV